MRTFSNRVKKRNFVAWCKQVEKGNKLPFYERDNFTSSWGSVSITNDLIRGAFIAHWTLILGGEINKVALPISIGTLTFMQYACDRQGRTDLVEVLGDIITNIPRIHNEIMAGEKDEEE